MAVGKMGPVTELGGLVGGCVIAWTEIGLVGDVEQEWWLILEECVCELWDVSIEKSRGMSIFWERVEEGLEKV
jgi:hypothetical protein